ncbi:MAG: AbrB/MazE/SpoVT family DNA-binding domain-containing protein [Patescibacteria group bacterium]
MKQIIQTFTLGRSVVATIPKDFGIKPGTKLQVQKLKDSIVFRPTKTKEDNLAKVKKLAGGMNFKKVFGHKLTPEELNKIIDEQYKNVLPRR